MLLQNFTPRRYQETILASSTSMNTLVVLPTGLGKTAIAAMLAAHRLRIHPHKKILFLAPTRPLAQQHIETFKAFFDLAEESFALFTGQVSPEKRQELWSKATFIFSTPQGMENDIMSRRLQFSDVSLLIVDEAHRAVGDYAYVYLAKTYHEQATQERILALTASPGSEEEHINEVCANLFIEQLEVRDNIHPEVAPYVQELNIKYHEVELGEELTKIQSYLKNCYDSKIKETITLGELEGNADNYSKLALLKAQANLHGRMGQGEKHFELLKTISLLAEALKIQHALELAETQSIHSLILYLRGLQQLSLTSKTKAVQNLVRDSNFKAALTLAERAQEEGKEHPKLKELKKLLIEKRIGKVDSDDRKKVIIFTQYRDTASMLKEQLCDIASSEIFVGQAKKGTTGLSQKKQKEMIDQFKENKFDILLATSVAEEGLDIPSVDLVIFYEPIPSAIRTVQRRGRTGRHSTGNVHLLLAKGTRDEGYRWSAHHKEQRMYRTLAKLQKNFVSTARQKKGAQQLEILGTVNGNSFEAGNKKLSEFEIKENKVQNVNEATTVVVDYREKGSGVMKALLAQNVQLTLEQLPVGDYRIGADIVVEYKNVRDFVDSIIDGRLLSQLRDLRTKRKPLLIIEGTEDLYSQRRIHTQAIQGMLATIISSYNIPLLRTSGPQETAGVIMALAKKANTSDERSYYMHTSKPTTLKEQQEYFISALPSIGAKLAEPLLQHFGSPIAVLMATKEELQEVDLIGEKKAEEIHRVLHGMYK